MEEYIHSKSFQKPTLFNKGMALGGVVGTALSWAGSALLATVAISNPAIALLGIVATAFIPLVGALVGGSMRKKEIEHENIVGKELSKPTMFNEGFFSGFFKSVATLTVGAIVTTALSVSIATPIAIAALALPLAMGLVTAASGKARMQNEYDQAMMRHNHLTGKTPAREQKPEMEHDLASGKSMADAELARREARGHEAHRA